ncbi:MAG: TIGR04063 family PEP-CTERM/XrtA system glycosyltransferase [Chakrabartia sp.]
MLRILHVLDHSLPLHSGYTFRTRAILKAQIERGWGVAGITGLRHSVSGPAEAVEDGLTFFRTPAKNLLPSPVGEYQEISALAARLDAVVDQWKPDILHAHSPVMNALAALRVGKRHVLPVVYEIRAFWEDAAVGNGTGREGSAKYQLTRTLETYAARRASGVVVICEGLKADLEQRGIAADKITVSPNGVDLALFGDPPPLDKALARNLGLENAEIIGFIGSFYDYEGLDDLIAAMPALVAARPNAHALLVGGGPMEAHLRAQATASSVAERIHFAGRVPHDEVDRYYSLIDILVYPRKKMRLTDLVTPLKPLEAMAQRRLVAASDVGGHRELIEDGVTGTLFAPDDPPALAAAVAEMLGNRAAWPERKAKGRKFVEDHRNWSSNISCYGPLYQRLTGLFI